MEKAIAAVIIGFFVILLIAAITFVSCLFLAWAWNFVMPLLWHAAPHLTWLHAFAVSIIVGILRGLLTVNINKGK